MLLDECNVGHGPFSIVGPLEVNCSFEIEIAIHAVTSTGMLKIVEQPAASNASEVRVTIGLEGARVLVELPPGQTAGNISEESLFDVVYDALRAQGIPVTKLAVGSGGRDSRMLQRSSHHLAFPKLARVFPRRPCLYLTFEDLEGASDLATQILNEIRFLRPQSPTHYVLVVDRLSTNGETVMTNRFDRSLHFNWSESGRHYGANKELSIFQQATPNTLWHGQAHLTFRYNCDTLGGGSTMYNTYSEIRAFVKRTSLHLRRDLEYLLGDNGTFTFTLNVNGHDAVYRWRCHTDTERIVIYGRLVPDQDDVSMNDDTYQNRYDGPFTIDSDIEVETYHCVLDFEIWAAPQKHDVYILPPLSPELDFLVVQHDDAEHQVFLYEGMSVGNVTSADLFWIVRHFFWVRGIALRYIHILPDQRVLDRQSAGTAFSTNA
jgi:hypothetical protein